MLYISWSSAFRYPKLLIQEKKVFVMFGNQKNGLSNFSKRLKTFHHIYVNNVYEYFATAPPIPTAKLDAMINESMRDIDPDEELSGDDDDPDILVKFVGMRE